MSELEHDAWEGEMGVILARAKDLVEGSRPAAGDSWKWAMGDTIAQMQDLVKRARESVLSSEVHATPEAAEAARKIAEQYNAFLPDAKLHKHRRGVLVDYAAVAGEFPQGDPVRTELSHSHARALARVKAPEARAALAEQAIRSGWSVARLQAEVSAAARPPKATTDSEEGSSGEEPKAQDSTWRCAQTGQAIADREAMVELRVQPSSSLGVRIKRGPKRGGAAKMDRNGKLPASPCVLRFESALALLTWLGASLEAAVPAHNLGPSGKPTSQVIVAPELKKSRTAKSATGGAVASEALTEQPAGEHPAEEG